MYKFKILSFILIFSLNSFSNDFFDVAMPEGFEDLSESQRTIIDYYYGNRFIGAFYTTYDSNNLTIEDPGTLVAQIGNFKNPDKILNELRNSKPSNTDEVCDRGLKPPECGIITPKSIGFIFNESLFRVDIFIHPNEQEIIGLGGPRYLKQPEDRFHSLSLFSGAFEDTNETDETYNLNLNQVFAYGNKRIHGDFEYSGEYASPFQMDQLFIQRDKKDFRYSFGYLNTNAFQLLPQSDILGLMVETNLDTRVDLEHSSTSPLIIYLSQLSQVSVFRGSQLLISSMYPAGTHEINTTQFPEGAYEVELKITEASGVVRNEKRYIVKSFILPPRKTHVFFLEGGIIQDSEDELGGYKTTGKNSFTIGDRYRFSKNWGYNLALALKDTKTFLNTGLVGIFNTNTLSLDHIINNKDDWGVNGFVQTQIGQFFTSLNYSKFSSEVEETENALDFDLGNFDQYTVQTGYQWDRLRILVSANSRKDRGEEREYSYGPVIEYPFTLKDGSSLRMVTNINYNSEDEMALSINFDMNFFRNKGFNAQGSLGGSRIENKEEEAESDLDFSGQLDYQTGRAGNKFAVINTVNRVSEVSSYEIKTLYTGKAGQYELYSNYSDQEFNKFRNGGTFALNLGINSDGLAFGGDGLYESGIIIKLNKNPKNFEYYVFINGVNKGIITSGDELFVSLAPYQVYNIWLKSKDEKGGIGDFNGEERQVTLYPGILETIEYDIKSIYVLISKIKLRNGEVVSNALVDGPSGYAETDGSGFFQGDIKEGTKFLSIKKYNCKIDLSSLEISKPIKVVEELLCD